MLVEAAQARTAFEDVVREVYKPLPRYRDVRWFHDGTTWWVGKGRLVYALDFERSYDRQEFAREIEKALNYVTEPEPRPIQVWLGLP